MLKADRNLDAFLKSPDMSAGSDKGAADRQTLCCCWHVDCNGVKPQMAVCFYAFSWQWISWSKPLIWWVCNFDIYLIRILSFLTTWSLALFIHQVSLNWVSSPAVMDYFGLKCVYKHFPKALELIETLCTDTHGHSFWHTLLWFYPFSDIKKEPLRYFHFPDC